MLSGFIIFHSSGQYFGRPRALPRYLFKRFRRVFPIYWVYTFAAFVMYLICLPWLGKDVLMWADKSWAGVLGSPVLYPADVVKNGMPVLPVAWTLTYEILFYAAFGVAILFKPHVVLALALLWIALILTRMAGCLWVSSPTSFQFILTETRNLEFLLGCAAAYALGTGDFKFTAPTACLLLLTGLAALAVAWGNAYLGFTWMGQRDFLQFGIPFFFIVTAVAMLDLTVPSNETLIGRFGIFFGDDSYSIYLTHYIVILVVKSVARQASLSPLYSFAAAVLVSLGIGFLAYLFIERPLLAVLTPGRGMRPGVGPLTDVCQVCTTTDNGKPAKDVSFDPA